MENSWVMSDLQGLRDDQTRVESGSMSSSLDDLGKKNRWAKVQPADQSEYLYLAMLMGLTTHLVAAPQLIPYKKDNTAFRSPQFRLFGDNTPGGHWRCYHPGGISAASLEITGLQ